MGKTTQHRKKPLLRDALEAGQGNRLVEDLLAAIDHECGFGRTVFEAEPCQSAFNLGRQSLSNDINQHLAALKKESQANQTK